jgi:hypothetical protein
LLKHKNVCTFVEKNEMFRYLAEPKNILAEPLGFAEPRLKNTALHTYHFLLKLVTQRVSRSSAKRGTQACYYNHLSHVCLWYYLWYPW